MGTDVGEDRAASKSFLDAEDRQNQHEDGDVSALSSMKYDIEENQKDGSQVVEKNSTIDDQQDWKKK